MALDDERDRDGGERDERGRRASAGALAGTPSSRIAAKAPASAATTIRASSAVTPWPGSRTAHQAITLAAARPTTGAIGDSLRAPADGEDAGADRGRDGDQTRSP